jgi:hypothetical protein
MAVQTGLPLWSKSTAGFWSVSLLADKRSQYLAREGYLNHCIAPCCIRVLTLTDVCACTWIEGLDCELDFADAAGQNSCV